MRLLNGQKCPSLVPFLLLLFCVGHVASLFSFSFFSFWFPGLWVGTCLFSFSFSFFFFWGYGCDIYIYIFLCVCVCLTRHDFFFNKLGDCFFFFFGVAVCEFFCFNWPLFFNKNVWKNLYKLTFSIPLLFHSQPNKKERN